MRVRAAITTITATITIMDDEPDMAGHVGDGASLPFERMDDDAISTTAGRSAEASAKLLIWLSPSFPVGSFAFSHALEWAVQSDRVRNAETTVAWLRALLEHGALRNDAIFAANAFRATKDRDPHALQEVNALALAMAGSKERYLETTAQGNAFVAIMRQAWRAPGFDWGAENLEGDVAYPVAVGTACAAHGISLDEMLRAHALAQVQNLISAVIRLSVIGHTDGQRSIAALLPEIEKLVAASEGATLADVGGAAFQSDIASLRHETQYSRLFRS